MGNKRKAGVIAVAVIVLFGVCAFLGNLLFHFLVSKPLDDHHQRKTIADNYSFVDPLEKPVAREGIYNFLLLGVDERGQDHGRSDTIIILSVNFKGKKAALLSIPRDTMVEIPTHGQTKINHAYAYGGERLTKIIVEQTTGIKIDHIVIANFDAFKRIVDSLGGVDIYVEKDMYYRDDYDGPDGFTIDLSKGKQHLDGAKSLQYVRFRDDEGDIGRAKRQQKFLQEISKRFFSANVIMEAPNIVRQINSSIRTDISFSDLVSFIRSVDPKSTVEMKTFLFEGHPEMIDDLSYWVADKEENKQQVMAMNDFVAGSSALVAQSEPKNPKEKPTAQQPAPAHPPKENVQEAPKDKLEEKKQEKQTIFLNSDPRDLDWQIAMLSEETEKRKDAREQLMREEEEERLRQMQASVIHEVVVVAANKPDVNGITIINTTGDESLATLAAEYLRNEGLPVGVISPKGNGKPNKKTMFVVGSNDSETISAIKGLPFRFSTLYRNKIDKPTLIIGEDFT